MESLGKSYKTQLDNIKATIQNSDLLNTYLDTEEEEDYKALAEYFEPQIQELYLMVADKNPLQLVALEQELLDSGFEGLYLPKVLGYSVLRGDVNEHVKYSRPQVHFKDILMAIINSSNFEMISKRTGQSIQIGFALSSDIWITNIINSVSNKKIKYFLQAQKLEKYRNIAKRRLGLHNYRKQFLSLNYLSTEFPDSVAGLQVMAPSIKNFLFYRAGHDYTNDSLYHHLDSFIKRDDFKGEKEYLHILMIVGMYFDLPETTGQMLSNAIDSLRKSMPDFENQFFKYLSDLLIDHGLKSKNDKRFSNIIDKSHDGEVSEYYRLMDVVHGKGYISEEAIDAVRVYYDSHEGRSIQNSCVRKSIFAEFSKFLSNLEPSAYHDYFEINKIFVQYMAIFANQKFNQNLKELSLKYVKKLLKVYTDKRGKDYQDIKKWVKATFSDLSFMTDKELVELFKTRRKKKTT
jgi:hypothetical protein